MITPWKRNRNIEIKNLSQNVIYVREKREGRDGLVSLINAYQTL